MLGDHLFKWSEDGNSTKSHLEKHAGLVQWIPELVLQQQARANSLFHLTLSGQEQGYNACQARAETIPVHDLCNPTYESNLLAASYMPE
jgi:hypothetical protein